MFIQGDRGDPGSTGPPGYPGQPVSRIICYSLLFQVALFYLG